MQDLFNRASRLYLDCQFKIGEIYQYRVGKRQVNKDKLLKEFDLLLQIMLMYTSLIDMEISDIELRFIDLLTVDYDCLKEYNKHYGTSYTWNNITTIFPNDDKFNLFVDDVYHLVSLQISDLLMFLASNDAFSETNDILFFSEKIKEILLVFIGIDGNIMTKEEAFVGYIIKRILLDEYNGVKEAFMLVNKEE